MLLHAFPALSLALLCAGLAGCAGTAPTPPRGAVDPAEFARWDCTRIADEQDRVQQRAADLAYADDDRAGGNIGALGTGVSLFWPAMFAMRREGPEVGDLLKLKARFEALVTAAQRQHCLPTAAATAAAAPLAAGERLVYEDRPAARRPGAEWALRLTALRRGEIEYHAESARGTVAGAAWRQDPAGNLVAAPQGALQWPGLLRANLSLGAVTAGDIQVAGNPLARARMRGQVVALGPQVVDGRRFDAVVIELFGEAPQGDHSERVDGAMVLDRATGLLLRLDLRSADRSFSLQRRLLRVEPARSADAPG
jgi:hypothetical protein